MATVRTIAALLLVLVAVTLATADDFPSRSQIRRWMRECRKESKLTKSKPIYAVKKTIAGLYDPRTRHAFRKTKMTFAKFEFAKIRKATEAEKCLVQCMAEKQDMINGTELNSEAILKAMMGLGKHINEMDMHTKCNMTELKRSTILCTTETHGSVKNCDLGYNLYECLKTAVMESLYQPEEQNTTEASVPTTASPTTETYQRTSTAAPSTSSRSERMHGHRFGHGPRYPRPIPDSGDSTQAEQDLSAPEPRPRRILRHPFRGIRRFPPPPPPADSADVAPTTGDSGEARDMLPPPPPTTGFGQPPPPPMEFNEIPPPPMVPHFARPYGFAPRPMPLIHHPMGHHHMGPMGPHPMHFHPMGPHPMPFNGMGPTHMPFQAMPPPPLGMSPSYVSYRQGAGMVQVYGENPAPWRQNWREMQRGQNEMTAIA